MSSKPKPSLKGGVGTQRLQPIRATQPFQLRQGASPARKSPSSSPTSMLPRSATDPRRNKWSSDHRNSPDRSDRKSPSSPGIKVTNRRSPSPRVCRTSSHDSVPAAYLTGQWPRELTSNSFLTPTNSGTSTKSTQTPVDWNNTEAFLQQTKGSKSLSNRQAGFQDVEVKQMKQQMRRIAKSSRQEKKERQSPVHANHAALPQSQTAQPRSISNPMPIYGRVPRRQNSLEGLNKEIENIIVFNNETHVRHTQGITPPDGHRAPLPRSSTRTMETQTPQGFAHDNNVTQNTEGHTPSPSSDQTLAVPSTTKVGEQGQSPCPKYASSPRPNNSYMFQREPPEGAESVTPFKEQDVPPYIIGSSCPDKQKVHFQISKNGSFSKWKPPCSEQNNNGDVLLSLSSAMKVKCEVEGKKAFNIDDM